MMTIIGIRATGLYLIQELEAKNAVRDSAYYGNPEGNERVVSGALPLIRGREDCTAADLEDEGYLRLEEAAWQLEDLGVVRIEFLQETLIDGEPDCVIELTEAGRTKLEAAKQFGFRGPEYTIDAYPVSEWLILLLQAGDADTPITLEDAMEHAPGGDVSVKDNYGNEYAPYSGTYAWAFEVCLWHHARHGTIVPFCENATQEALWKEFVAKTGRPSRPSPHDEHPLWKVRFWLAADYENRPPGHVGRVS
jgi:hypothetical protein